MPLIIDLYPEGEANPMNKITLLKTVRVTGSVLYQKKKTLVVMCSLY